MQDSQKGLKSLADVGLTERERTEESEERMASLRKTRLKPSLTGSVTDH